MKKLILTISILAFLPSAGLAQGASTWSGYILLQVEKNGEAWYVYPKDEKRYFLGRPADAFNIMKKLSLGAPHQFIEETRVFPERLAGRILLDVEQNGEAYYIHPETRKKHYLDRPKDAFQIIRRQGQGISNKDLATILKADTKNDLPVASKIIIENVPFTPQAPFADWQDPRQQDGCEEASALMAVRWVRGQELSRQEALNKILDLSDFLENKYGEYRDTSLPDMKDQIFRDYFDYNDVEVQKDIQIKDIIRELDKGNLVLTPMDGQKLPNPYYTPPGPSRHMIVVRGYNPKKEVFITNDPGTRHGELFQYDTRDFYDSIRAYPTGYHEPIPEISRDIITVKK